MKKKAGILIFALLAVLAASAALWLMLKRPPPPAPPVAEAPVEPPPAPAAPAASLPAPPPAHPIEQALAVSEPASAPTPAQIDPVLAALFGRAASLPVFLQDDVVHRIVATVDNLGRAHASTSVWPVERARGHFQVERREDASVIGSDNAMRYARYLQALDAVDLATMVSAYKHLYAQFQQAYLDLGYPQGYFNDRLVTVVDLLLATPEGRWPLAVHVPVVEGASQPEYALYDFDDPALEQLAAGQKILLRLGPDGVRRVKTRLVELRRLLTGAAAPR